MSQGFVCCHGQCMDRCMMHADEFSNVHDYMHHLNTAVAYPPATCPHSSFHPAKYTGPRLQAAGSTWRVRGASAAKQNAEWVLYVTYPISPPAYVVIAVPEPLLPCVTILAIAHRRDPLSRPSSARLCVGDNVSNINHVLKMSKLMHASRLFPCRQLNGEDVASAGCVHCDIQIMSCLPTSVWNAQ
jgi:hypothetical protein